MAYFIKMAESCNKAVVCDKTVVRKLTVKLKKKEKNKR